MRPPWLHPDRISGYPAKTRVSTRLAHKRAKKHNYHHRNRLFQNHSGKSENNRHGCNRNRLPCQHAAYLAFTHVKTHHKSKFIINILNFFQTQSTLLKCTDHILQHVAANTNDSPATPAKPLYQQAF